MKRKKNFYALIFFLLFALISCQKEISNGNSEQQQIFNASKLMVTSEAQKDILIEWLNLHKASLNSKQAETFDNILKCAEFRLLTVEHRKNGESLIVIPINTKVKKTLSERANYPKFDDNTIFNLLIVQNSKGKLRWSSIITYHPTKELINEPLPKETIQSIINGENVNVDGIYSFINLKGQLQYQIQYKKGRLISVSKPIREDLLGNRKINSPTSRNSHAGTRCWAWYLVTTWYYPDGSTEVTEEYLFTTCDQDNDYTGGGGGGSGGDNNEEPEEPNDHDIVVTGQDEEYETVYYSGDLHQPIPSNIPEEQDLDQNGNVITPPIVEYPLKYVYPWAYSYRIIGGFKINYVIAQDALAHPSNITYPSPQGVITRQVTLFDHQNSQDIIGPTSAKLTWRFIANKRWTYHLSGISEVRQRNGSHTKTINF